MKIVAAFYFAYLAAAAIARVRVHPAVLALAAFAAVLVIGMPHIMPVVYLLLGYWLPALIVRRPNVDFERRLLNLDRRLFGANGLARFEQKTPRAVLEYLEVAYLLCYAVVPAGYAALMVAGFEGQTIDRFWTVVLSASFICYGLLPWLPTRAPRALEADTQTRRSSIRKLNLAVLNRASVQWNTFPSGHTAASVATALAVAVHIPVAGLILGVVAVSIAIASVVGRYHYAADAVAGAVVAVVVFLTVCGELGL